MSDAPAADVGSAKTPADFLKSIRGKSVVVKLNSGVDYRGILACLDGYMNICHGADGGAPRVPRASRCVARETPPRVETDPRSPPRHPATLNPPAPPLPPPVSRLLSHPPSPVSWHPANPKSTPSILRPVPRLAGIRQRAAKK